MVVFYASTVLMLGCGYQLQTHALLDKVARVEITGELDPRFKQVLMETIRKNGNELNQDHVNRVGTNVTLNFMETQEGIEHLRFDEFREAVQSELVFECDFTVATGGGEPTSFTLTGSRRFNYDRDNLLAVRKEQQYLLETLYEEQAFRIVLILAEISDGRSSNN